ncbi:MAG: class I SAM-dependent methyltransferase [Deltaproteobacteria bacterium]|nr:class I SAM-dependent methyltransferase [Deltaproteobacteria bacterium]
MIDPAQSPSWRLNLDRATPASQGIEDARDIWQQPERVVEALGLCAGARVADLGAGTGYFIPHLVRALALRAFAAPVGDKACDKVGGARVPVETSCPAAPGSPAGCPGGTIWAVDRAPFASWLRGALSENARRFVEVVDGDVHELELPSSANAHAILACNLFHQLHDPVAALNSWRRWLAPGARVVIVDFFDRNLPVGPARSELVGEWVVLDALREAKYRVAERQALPYQYLISATTA